MRADSLNATVFRDHIFEVWLFSSFFFVSFFLPSSLPLPSSVLILDHLPSCLLPRFTINTKEEEEEEEEEDDDDDDDDDESDQDERQSSTTSPPNTLHQNSRISTPGKNRFRVRWGHVVFSSTFNSIKSINCRLVPPTRGLIGVSHSNDTL